MLRGLQLYFSCTVNLFKCKFVDWIAKLKGTDVKGKCTVLLTQIFQESVKCSFSLDVPYNLLSKKVTCMNLCNLLNVFGT